MRAPIHQFCDLVLGWLLEAGSEEEKAKLLVDLNAPLKGEARRDPTPEELEAETDAMLSLGRALR